MLAAIVLILSLLTALGICWGTGSFDALCWLWVLPLSFAGAFVLFVGLAFLILYLICCSVDMEVPQEHDSPFFRKLATFYCKGIIWILRMKVNATGLEKVPQSGRFLLVCNHLFDLDPVVLFAYFGMKQLAFISKRENSSMIIVGKLMHRTMCQMINRENDREALKTILKCIQLIKDDEVSIAVFPEGYCSKDHHLQKLRSGALKIATKTKVPITVCTIQGTDRVVDNLKHLRSSPIELHVLGVIPPEEIEGRTAVDIGEQIYQMMADDLIPYYAPLAIENP